MKKLLSALLVVVFILTSLGITAFAEEDYTAQPLGDGFTRLTLTNQVVSELKKYYADKLFKVPISRTVRISEAPGYGEPICYHDPYGKGALEYAAVAKELMLRI